MNTSPAAPRKPPHVLGIIMISINIIMMLDLAATFANKWKLSFNHEKSNVLIVRRRMDALRMWRLGDSYISEVNTYKYLGVTFSRHLSDHNHSSDVVKKGNRIIGYVKSIIDGHDDFQRVYYGKT